MKKWYKYILIFTFIFMIFSPSMVQARSAIATATAPGINPGDEPMGKIILYDDYKIAFHYGYRVNSIVIDVCKDSICNNVKQAENQTFMGNSVIEFDLNDLLIRDSDKKVTYVVKATGAFKAVEGLGFESVATLNTEVSVKPINSKDDDSNRILDSTEGVLGFINMWVIPGIYAVLVVTLIIKSILLVIDLVKYSDNSEVRREKLKAFAYIFIGIVCVAIINSTAGIITGLFG